MDNFVNLHLHDNFSFLDGLSRTTDVVDKSLKMGQPAVCVTNHGNLFGLYLLFQYANKKGQKPIAGFEAYVVEDRHVKGGKSTKDEAEQSEANSKREHLVVLAKNNEGFKHLSHLCSIGWREGFYYRPRIDDDAITQVGTQGLIASSACVAGRIPQALLRDDYAGAKYWAEHYAQLFPEGFWLEIQPTEMPEQVKVNKGVMDIAKETGIPLLATTDAHYLNKEDKATHDVLLCMQTNRTMDDPNRWTFHGNTYFMMSRDECVESFTRSGHEVLDQELIRQAVDESVRIAELCNVELKTDVHYLPRINIPENDPDFIAWRKAIGEVTGHDAVGDDEQGLSAAYLRFLSTAGLQRRCLVNPEYVDRLELELKVIHDMGFPDYFLIYEDIAKYCRDHALPMGPGRGCGRGDNLVHTTTGLKRLDAVRVGDVVRAHDGEDHQVTAVHEYAVTEPLVTIETEDGRALTMTADHKVLAVRDHGEPTWLRMDELTEDDFLVDVG
jgi:DNA polymerase-3 subunit alpha